MDLPLKNTKHEAFVQLMAVGGMSQTAAYRQIWSRNNADLKDSSARSNGHRIAKRPDVKKRIASLRRQELADQIEPDEHLTRGSLLALAQQCTDALQQCHRVAEKAGASPRVLQQIRKAQTVHSGRIMRLTDVGEPLPTPVTSLNTFTYLDRMPLCSCNASETASEAQQ